ncbi:MAG: hypothetical protein ACE37K_02505 [Planctomycetota bacterium]
MRPLPLLALCALVACHSAPAEIPESALADVPEPTPPVALRLPAGTRVAATVSDGLPVDGPWRAVRTWWREAIGQTVAFSIAPKAYDGLAQLALTIDVDAKALTATLLRDGTETLLASAAYGEGLETPGLLAAIDQLAWAARRALGEAATRPLPVGRITSEDPRAVIAVEDADELIRTGGFSGAFAALRTARRHDGGAPFVLAPLAALELLRNDPTRARDISREALGYAARCSPTVQHRLARTLLLANAALEPRRAGRFDRELTTLAAVARRERPHDDEPRYTDALGHNFLADFATSRPLLEDLHRRLPERGFVAYHLGWACLGTDDAVAAAEHLREASLRLPTPWVLLPWAIALFESRRDDELGQVLDRARRDYGSGDRDSISHQVLRMQAAHALLTDQPERARELLLDDLRWLVKHPLALDARVGDFAEAGAVLVRLGSSDQLPNLVAAVQKLPVEAVTRDAAAFVGGMHQVLTTGVRAEGLEDALARDGDSAWSSLLAAYAHEREGEVGAMQNALARAALLSASPLTKALLARSLRAVGKAVEADRLHDTLKREMLTMHLRQPCQHPLFGPELAYAYLLR